MWNRQRHLFDRTNFAQLPVVISTNAGYKVFFSTRNEENKSRIESFIFDDFDFDQSTVDIKIEIEPGQHWWNNLGIVPSCIVGNHFYVSGWNDSQKPYHQSCGLVLFENDQWKQIEQPLIESKLCCNSPFVMNDNGTWRMWYGRGTRWEDVKGTKVPIYTTGYAESSDGIKWVETDDLCLRRESPTEIISRPHVIKEDSVYKMWFGHTDVHAGKKYSIGYAESSDGVCFQRIDDHYFTQGENGWDDEMVCYPYLSGKHVIYNGNGYGKTGFGLATR